MMYEKFEKELDSFKKMIKEGEPELEIDNEYSRLSEKYALGDKLTQRGYKNLKKISEKYWSGVRLDDQELTLAYVLCPKIILYEKVTYRMLDMVAEIESEVEKRWGSINPPIKLMAVCRKLIEPNPDYVDNSFILILSAWKEIPFSKAIESNEMALNLIDWGIGGRGTPNKRDLKRQFSYR